MTIGYNPSIVTTNLQLCLDAANPRSYPGTGTAWRDVSSAGNNGTLVNGPVYSSSNRGTITFDGVDDYCSTSATVEAATNSNLQTISGWLIGNGALFGSNAGGIGQFHLRVSLSGTTLTYNVSYYGGAGGETNDTATVTPNSVNNIVIVKTAAEKYDVYFNTVKVMNQVTKKATVSTSFYPGLYYTGQYNAGTVSNYLIYNRTLSSDEITQNFNAYRGRYGI